MPLHARVGLFSRGSSEAASTGGTTEWSTRTWVGFDDQAAKAPHADQWGGEGTPADRYGLPGGEDSTWTFKKFGPRFDDEEEETQKFRTHDGVGSFHDKGRPHHAHRRGGRWVVGGYGMAHPPSVSWGFHDVPAPRGGVGSGSQTRSKKAVAVRRTASP